jgi:hypothetical protein
MLRVLLVLLAMCTAAHSEEGIPRESEHKADSANADNHNGSGAQQITVPANSASPTIINIFPSKHTGEESQCTKPKDWKEWGSFAWCRSWEFLDAERIIAAFTVILAFATYALWRATDKLVRGADKNAERQLRPYVHASVAHFFWDQNGVRAIVELTNSGETPATFFELGAISQTAPRDAGHLINIPADLQYRRWAPLGGGKSSTIGVRGIVSDEQIDPFAVDARDVLDAKGEKNFYVLGRIRYGDVFGSEYETEFAFFTSNTRPGEDIKMMIPSGDFVAFRRTKRGRYPA